MNTTPLTFVIFGRDAETCKELRDALLSAGSSARIIGESTTPDEMLADVARLRPSAAIITLKTDHMENSIHLIKNLLSVAPGTAVITASRETSAAVILGSLRAGALEFLQLPTAAEEMRTVLARIEEFSQNVTHKQARVVAVFSGKGGAGVSFFGTNLAAAMNSSTLIVDLNLQAGDTASFLGLDPKYSLVDFARNLNRLDDSLTSSLITPHSERLSVLAAPVEAHEAEEITPEALTEILHLLARKYECIVLDLPHTFDPVTLAALDFSDDVLLVLTLDIPGLRSTKRALKVFNHLGYPKEKTNIVVNRWSKNIDVELHKVEAHLGRQIIGFVPNDYQKVMDSINLGRPLVQTDPGSKVTLEIKRIAGLVTEGANGASPQVQQRRKPFRSLFGRQSSGTSLELSVLTDNA